MKLLVFAIYDSQVCAYLNPFVTSHPSLAKRSFQAVATDPRSQIYNHPQDFTLFEVGEWDDETGLVRAYDRHINHGLATIYKSRGHNGQEPPEQVGDATPVRTRPESGDSA